MSELVQIKTFFENNDNIQKIQVFFFATIELIKIALASLLSVFVPQNCEGKVCSIIDNFSELSKFNIYVIIINFILFTLFIGTYIYEIKREYFMIDNFDTDHNTPDDNLGHIIEMYPEVHKRLLRYNNMYHKLCLSLYIIFIINWISSAILVFHYFYLDKNTITVMISNLLLVSSKIHRGYILSKTSKETPSISAYLSENLIFNIMDIKKYKNKTNELNSTELILIG